MIQRDSISTERGGEPVLNIICFVLSLAVSSFLAWRMDDVWFYAAHAPGRLQIATGTLAIVIVVSALLVLRSRRMGKAREAFALSLFGMLSGLVTVVFYAPFIWNAGGRG